MQNCGPALGGPQVLAQKGPGPAAPLWKPYCSWEEATGALEHKAGDEVAGWRGWGPSSPCLSEAGLLSLTNWLWERKPEITWNIQERKSKHPFFLLILQNICSFVLFRTEVRYIWCCRTPGLQSGAGRSWLFLSCGRNPSPSRGLHHCPHPQYFYVRDVLKGNKLECNFLHTVGPQETGGSDWVSCDHPMAFGPHSSSL